MNTRVITFSAIETTESANGFRRMTFPAFRAHLDFGSTRATPLAVGAFAGARPVGLGLASPAGTPDRAEFLSLFVDPEFRRQGLGTALMRRTMAECDVRGVRELSAIYMTGRAGTAAVERILSVTGWDAPETRMLVLRCSLESMAPAPWLTRLTQPPGFETVPWVDITEAEREAIRVSHAQTPWIAPDLVPFDFEQGIEPLTSVALRVRGEVLGWCLNHVVGDVLRFTCSFVRRDLQRLGRILLLYREAVAQMPGTGLSVGMWTVPVEHQGMAAFARNHLRPYSVFFAETRGVRARCSGARVTSPSLP